MFTSGISVDFSSKIEETIEKYLNLEHTHRTFTWGCSKWSLSDMAPLTL